jgi:hypothetical protein
MSPELLKYILEEIYDCMRLAEIERKLRDNRRQCLQEAIKMLEAVEARIAFLKSQLPPGTVLEQQEIPF